MSCRQLAVYVPTLHMSCHINSAAAGKTYRVKSFGVGTVIRLSYTIVPSDTYWVQLRLVSDSGEILLLFNPRSSASGHVLVLNSFLNGAWGAEERPAGFPFDATAVQVVVAVEDGGYRITANGGAFQYLYKHRLSPSLVTSMATDFDDIQYGAVSRIDQFIVSSRINLHVHAGGFVAKLLG